MMVCTDCNNSGIVQAHHAQNHGLYAFKCGCPMGQLERRNYPRWSARYDGHYLIAGRKPLPSPAPIISTEAVESPW